MNKKPETNGSRIAIWDEKARKEKMLYLAICPQRDYDVLTLNEDMTLEDFERIYYVLGALEFTNYLIYLQKEYEKLYIEYADSMEREIDDSSIDMLDSYEEWIINFCSQLPTERMRECIGSIL